MPINEDVENTVKIAVLTSEVNGLREQHKSHAETMIKKLDEHAAVAEKSNAAIMGKVESIANWMQQNHEMPEKVKTLWDAHHNQRGFLRASSFVGGGIAAIAITFVERLFR